MNDWLRRRVRRWLFAPSKKDTPLRMARITLSSADCPTWFRPDGTTIH